jgi:hypothetical protein
VVVPAVSINRFRLEPASAKELSTKVGC